MSEGCPTCAAKDQTIAAQQQTIQALNELINTQRAVALPPPLETVGPQTPALSLIKTDPEREVDDIRDALNAGGLEPEAADRLYAQLQVAGPPEE